MRRSSVVVRLVVHTTYRLQQ